MTDVFSPQKRSEIMSRVRGQKNAATELKMIEVFRRYKISGWRRGLTLFGKPDFVFPAQKLALFVDGCFWHACPIHGSLPNQNSDFWNEKLKRNVSRDRLVGMVLRKSGWRVLRIWQHDLKGDNFPYVARKVKRSLESSRKDKAARNE